VLEHRALRFVVEALILVAVATAVAVAGLRPLVIAGVMLLAWALVALLEWAFLQGESHFASGLPPRYKVPQPRLPAPRQPQALDALAPIPIAPVATGEPAPPAADQVFDPEPAPSPDEAESWVDEPPPEIHDAPPAQEQARADESEERVDPAVLLPDDQAFGPGEAAWFDSELPGVADDARLFEAVLAELEDEWERAGGSPAQRSDREAGVPESPGVPESSAGRRLLPGRSRRDS
jgi:hypothetical protein